MKSLKPNNIEIAPNQNGTFNISKEQYELLKKAKKREDALTKEQLIYEREKSIKLNELHIRQADRHRKFKQEQIDTSTFLESGEEYHDKIKPKFALENDIDQIDFTIDTFKDNLKKLEEEQAKDVQ